MVRAVMAVVHLDRLRPQRQRQHLVAEADAEDGQVGVEHAADHRHGVAPRGRRIARAVRQEDAIGVLGQTSSAVVVAGMTVTSQPALARQRRMLRLAP
jgi:hypothetical protein